MLAGLSSTMRISSFAMAYRDRERERRARAQLALDPDSSAVQLDELPAQGQPQASALHLLVCRSHLTELLKHCLLILWGDSDARVGNRDLDVSILGHCADINAPTFWRELDRVRQQVQHDLANLAFIGLNLAKLLIDVCMKGD